MEQPRAMNAAVPVLDKGLVQLLWTAGTDLDVVNDAKASFERSADALGPKEARLIQYLGQEDHEAPFRGIVMKLRVRAPLLVARQWWKYVVASRHVEEQSSWNEASRRYVTDSVEFYVPEVWRGAPENRKQGSSGELRPFDSGYLTGLLKQRQAELLQNYEEALELGACAEQARLLLPAYGLYVSWHWLASLQAISHFVRQRLGHGAQSEIRDYALVVDRLAREAFPLAWAALMQDEKAALRARIVELERELEALR